MKKATAPEKTAKTVLDMPGLEADNLLAFLALLGLLRALEQSRHDWNARACWAGPPWLARLHVDRSADEQAVARAAAEGVEALARRFDVGDRTNVSFEGPTDFRLYAESQVRDPVGATLAAAMTAEAPAKRGGGLQAAPLVMMFGQGHQNFLERLVAVPRGDVPHRLKKKKPTPNMRDPAKLREALFEPWRREDDADAFRWDPEEDQRYALRADNPSSAGAAPTVHGANRLAAIGFLSFACAPGVHQLHVPGVTRERGEGMRFVWPLWTAPLPRRGIEAFLSHPDVLAGRLRRVRPLGVADILAARRISNGKFVNVTRARSVGGEG